MVDFGAVAVVASGVVAVVAAAAALELTGVRVSRRAAAGTRDEPETAHRLGLPYGKPNTSG